jgi:hypothetical protein
MSYRFRLTIGCKQAGLFRFQDQRFEFALDDSHRAVLVARDADLLVDALSVHFDGYDYVDEESARQAGNRLRVRLRVLNAILNLGINVPVSDSVTGGAAQSLKEEAARTHGVTVLDNVSGVSVHPNDGLHVEYVMSGHGKVHKPDSNYLITGIQNLWRTELSFDQSAEDALSIIGLATRETSDRAAFLTSYLALESLIPRSRRSDIAQSLLDDILNTVQRSNLETGDRDSLSGAISMLREESFRSAVMKFAERISPPPTINGLTLKDFLDACIRARNAIAHNATPDPAIDLHKLSAGLRQFVLTVIWSKNRIPNFSLDVPGDQISFGAGGIAFRIL